MGQALYKSDPIPELKDVTVNGVVAMKEKTWTRSRFYIVIADG